jgi:hypothetical protein
MLFAITAFLATAIVSWIRKRHGGAAAFVIAAALILVLGPLVQFPARALLYATYVGVPPARIPIALLDLTLSQRSREEVVRLAADHELESAEYGAYALPQGSRGLSVHGTVEVIDDPCGQRVFFMTMTGFSPDPYAGFEYVPAGCAPELDPLGSGHGVAEPLGSGWFWIQAS